jgi:ribosomal protein L40E
MSKICPKCGFENSLDNKVCRGCFHLLSDRPRQEARRDPPELKPPAPDPLSDLQRLRLIVNRARLILGLIFGAFLGLVLLLWELGSSTIAVWGIVHPILLMAACTGALVAVKREWF